MEIPQGVDSKYRFILVAAKRARQLQAGTRPLIQTATKKPIRVAQLEVGANLVPFETFQIEPGSDGEVKAEK